ncbi:MAG: succinate dehydrogenase iron-sulfur subunit [Deltaproteobacteria bacterium]|nr:succinate dehydrogenase iron-sulfur subunit [Deltaproteobacteria bacterium]
MEKIYVKIKRRNNPNADSYWEDFQVPKKPGMNVVSALMEIRKNPVNARGIATTPVVWEAACLEEVCGSCTMVINGKVGQACSALIDRLDQPITLEPMKKFPVVRDLVVDRSKIFDALKRVKAWIPIDGAHGMGGTHSVGGPNNPVPGPRVTETERIISHDLACCIACGACLEACPQVNDKSPFIGAAAINQVRLFNRHPIGRLHRDSRLEALMGEGGIDDCGNAQNCVRACPKEIPLTESIAEVGREVTKYAVGKLLGR